MPRRNVGTAHLLFGAWLLLMIQSALPNMVLCAKPGMPINFEFASLDSRCECGPFIPAGIGQTAGFLSADDSCSDNPFVTDFGKTIGSAKAPSGCGSVPDMAGIEPLTAELEEIPRFRNGVDRRRAPLFSNPLSESLRC